MSSLALLGVVVSDFLSRFGIAADRPGAVASGTIQFFWLLNLLGTRLSGRLQTALSAAKFAAMLAIVVVLFFHQGPSAAPGRQLPVSSLGVLAAIPVILSTYSGAGTAVYFSEEMKTPERTLPRAILSGIAMVSLVYLLVNGAILHVLAPGAVGGSKLAAADALNAAVGQSADLALTLFGILSVAAVIHLGLMFTARLVFAMARDGVLPQILARVAKGGTPVGALTATALSGMLLAASGAYLPLISMNVALSVFAAFCGTLAVVRLRQTEPELPRPWRVPFYPWPVVVALVVQGALLVMLVAGDPWHSLIGGLVLGVIGCVYWLNDRLLHARKMNMVTR